tara:strand:- start:905 stop:2245 length:1341 start_codon:yes stop_codon:yes gene_type:complete
MSGKMRIVLKRYLIVGLIVLTGCVSESQSDIVAQVEDWILTETRLADLLVLAQPFPLDSAAVEDLVRHWVGAAAIAQVSSNEDLYDGEEVVRFSTWLEREESILQQEREQRLGETVVVDSSMVERFFRDGSYRLLAHVLRRVGAETTQEERALQRRTAQRILDELIAGGSWSAAVSESEDSDTREASGLLGLLGRGELLPELDRVAFQLQPGQVSGITQTSRGFHILHRPRLEEVSDLYAMHLRDRFLTEAEERSDQGLLVQRSWLISSDAITSLREIADDPSAWLGTDLLLGSWQGGTLSAEMAARYVLALPPAARREMVASPDESLGAFVEQLAVRGIRLGDARERGLELSEEVLVQLKESHQADVRQWYQGLAIDEMAAPERSNLTQYMEGVVSRRGITANLRPLFEVWLLERVDWVLVESSIPKALLKVRNLLEGVEPSGSR